MKFQIYLFVILVGIIFVTGEEKDSEVKSTSKRIKRGLFELIDFGTEHEPIFRSGDNFNSGHDLSSFDFDNHHHKEHITHDFKEIHVPIVAPYPVPIEKEVPLLYPVKVPVHVPNPVPYPVIKPYPVAVERLVPYPVIKNVPFPVKVSVKVPYPVKVPYVVEKPYPIPVEQTVPYFVKKPYIVEEKVPYLVKEDGHSLGVFGHGLENSHLF